MAASTDLLFLECLSKSRRKSEMAAITHGCLKWRCAVHEPSFLLSAGELLDILGQGQQTLIRRRSDAAANAAAEHGCTQYERTQHCCSATNQRSVATGLVVGAALCVQSGLHCKDVGLPG
eukprot:CAMPEP_0206143394 /NCGR_PEP_ID=MMETSP1473-20131121/20433_1 /ASSEMBLY_ACC=CAM_ASM_001109 /TAXON_ID=1461547 /ORGANISM="Stichococcus sp, Strain RCC1054" /LENGTH=119 /DNA_ID=CAMNT_0053538781 /DNA_START=262 /DNA_END=621 /DNA_ORIENTATION=-